MRDGPPNAAEESIVHRPNLLGWSKQMGVLRVVPLCAPIVLGIAPSPRRGSSLPVREPERLRERLHAGGALLASDRDRRSQLRR